MMYKVMTFLVLCLGIEIIVVIKKMDKLHRAYETLSQKEKVKTTAVAFSVSDPNSRSLDKTLQQYNKIHINLGDDFCPETGIFTCSKTGVYYFIATLVKKNSIEQSVNTLHCSIYKNNSRALRLYFEPSMYAKVVATAISNSVVLSLSVGDTVFVGDCLDSQSLDPWSSFSGFLLYPLT